MSSAFTFPATSTPDVVLPPYPVRQFSVEDYFKLIDAGVLGEDDNCELLEGWIVPKMGKKPLHDGTIDLVLAELSELLPSGWYPRVQNVLQTATSAPEPDFAVTRGQPGSFTDRHPQGSDVGLVIEVADSSLQTDRRKAGIYAAAAVPIYWIVNLPERCVEVFTDPQPRGSGMSYGQPRVFRNQDELELILDGKVVSSIKCTQLLPT